ncbi:hypothetical protein GW537_16635 (plasmid) [Piscirickettsia salmonis]|nr:hypothetical protein [Piscirickettsia salmonis]QHS29329.1 hypothetical protein GW537_09680 [Piscirickettsia salmonis]QHS29336.1 hypothetical protein GW537_09715 [Piscirickettsia salmonis]QHS29339.1 hypothetical protein GW537_09750 [Piscirickettsia salmonis]QHS29346.1 hypothetical protein GW537_09785 [Piscirickettsia salmonis]QHS30730.1 hypothetical protein GW537_16600 [Piscirickettsia salmonis]
MLSTPWLAAEEIEALLVLLHYLPLYSCLQKVDYFLQLIAFHQLQFVFPY